MKIMRSLLWVIISISLLLTWLPYFNIFNHATMIGFLPQPLALTLCCNIVVTLCVLAMYPLYFKPFIAALEKQPLNDGANNNE